MHRVHGVHMECSRCAQPSSLMYYLRNRDEILLLRSESYRNKSKERNKNKDNVVIASNEIIISILED